jgi:aryl-alcohol dehydrogenase-like predicted oxidoreductase
VTDVTPSAIRRIDLPLGDSIPVLGQGTLGLGGDPDRWDAEVAALQLGLDLGMTLVETGEMYGNGAAEELVGDALVGRRDEVFLVTKVGPAHASRREIGVACEQSLRRLGTEWIDLYLLHTRGFDLPDETLESLDDLLRREMVSLFGVSHYSVPDLEELVRVRDGVHLQIDEVPYNLMRRGVERELLPWCRTRGIPILACSPLEHGALVTDPALQRIAQRHGATPAQVALAWLVGQPQVSAIARATSLDHVRENRGALDLHFTREDYAELDRSSRPQSQPSLSELG